MIQQIVKKISCPSCGKEGEVILWEKVNVNMNPDLKEKLFDESINSFSCKACGYKGRVDIPLYYNDAKAKFFVYLVPDYPVGMKEEEELIANLNAQTLHILDSGYDQKIRVVFEYFSLLEKISIFDAGLDDRAVEGCKVLARTQLKLVEGRASFASLDKDSLVFNFFEKEDKKASQSFSIPRDMYDEVKSLMEKKDQEESHTFRIVDVKFAVRMLMGGIKE